MKEMTATATESTAAIQRAEETCLSPATKAKLPKDADMRRNIRRYRKQARACPDQHTSAEDLVLPDRYKIVLTDGRDARAISHI